MTRITMYTDGAARGNPDGPGGYGTILSFVDSKGQEHIRELSAGYQKTTNNRMEMMAVIAGLEALNRPCEITVYSDSQYVVKAFNEHWLDGWIKKGWKRGKNEPVKNVDLWKRMLAAKEPHQVSFQWVKDITDIRRMSAAMSWQQRQPTEPVFWLMRDWSNRIAYSQKKPAERQRKRRKSETS